MDAILRHLKLIVARLRGERPPWLAPPQDPFAGVRQPRWRRPGGRESAAAVLEPQPDRNVDAVGRPR
jgi:hypothetical protein